MRLDEVRDAAGIRLAHERRVRAELADQAPHTGDVRPDPAVVDRVVEEHVAAGRQPSAQ